MMEHESEICNWYVISSFLLSGEETNTKGSYVSFIFILELYFVFLWNITKIYVTYVSKIPGKTSGAK